MTYGATGSNSNPHGPSPERSSYQRPTPQGTARTGSSPGRSSHESPSHESPSHESASHESASHESPSHESPSQESASHEGPGHEGPSQESPGQESPSHEGPGHESPGHEGPSAEAPGRGSLRVLALEPYYTLSHRAFLEGYRNYSRNRVEIWSMEPRKWKWRMRGAAVHFADQAAAVPPGEAPDAIIASDFLNLADWRAFAPRHFKDRPCLLYFHENQVTFPLGEKAPADVHYGWINLGSALSADRVLFNSAYHEDEFLRGVELALGRMPDYVPEDIPGRIRRRSSVFPVGIDFAPHRRARERAAERETRASAEGAPIIAWNHRWEYDKGPDLLADTLAGLKAEGVPFRLILCGQSFRDAPEAFERMRSELREEILHFGFVADQEEYLSLLSQADVVLSTARQEFFGVSVVEAMFLGCLPVLPRALSYPEILPPGLQAVFLYDGPGALKAFLRRFLKSPPVAMRPEVEACAARFDWAVLAGKLDEIVETTVEAAAGETLRVTRRGEAGGR